MTADTHQTAPTQFVEANGIRFAYRRFGKPDGVPLVFNQHFTGTMDHWDPAVTDGLARDREVILFNNAGVSSSSGEVPTTFRKWAPMRWHSSRRWDCRKSMCSAFRSAALLHRKSRFRPPISSGASFWSAPARAVAKAWLRARQRRRKSSAPPMTSPIIFGFTCTLRSPRRARLPAASSSSASVCAPRTAIPR